MNMRSSSALGAIVLVTGALWSWQFVENERQALYSYLFAFIYVMSLVVGTLFLLMIGHATNAKWFVPLRRPCERVVATLPLLMLAIFPILLCVHQLYPWTAVHALSEMERHHVEKKLSWLNVPFFVSRSVGYMAIFVLFGELLCRWSRRQDVCGSAAEAARLRQRMVRLSVGGLVVLSLVFTFACWDWVMSLEPAWYSNLFGVYLFAGGLLAGLGLIGAISVAGRRTRWLPREISSSHYHALGRLQLAIVMLWAYLGWCHVLQQWIANLPVEALWYLKRWHHGWQWQGLVLIVAHFVLPFLALLSRSVKRNPATFFAVSVWLVMVHAIDVHYLVLPALHHASYHLDWLDPVVLLGLIALTACFGGLRGRTLGSVPLNDPLLPRGLRYEGPS